MLSGVRASSRNTDAVPAPVAIEADFVEAHRNCVAGFGAFDENRSREDVIAIEYEFAGFVAAARIKELGDDGVAWVEAGGGRMGGESLVLAVRLDSQGFG